MAAPAAGAVAPSLGEDRGAADERPQVIQHPLESQHEVTQCLCGKLFGGCPVQKPGLERAAVGGSPIVVAAGVVVVVVIGGQPVPVCQDMVAAPGTKIKSCSSSAAMMFG